ncbi:MAG: hypothetical protein NUV46_04380 [Nanoarchaeota archaeon]|nr:hypothetical protein [Nanoarchaeota archaeon]
MKKVFIGGYEFLLIFIFLFFIFLFVLNSFSVTGNITEGITTSNVSLSKYLAINMGENLSEGIQFGTVAFLPSQNVNASHNYDGSGNSTTYSIEVHLDSNTAVDFCIKANTGLTSVALDVIGLSNETYTAYNFTNLTHPEISNETPITTSYVKAVSNIFPGNSSYWRFWLDIPAAQATGEYNNTLSFQGLDSGNLC